MKVGFSNQVCDIDCKVQQLLDLFLEEREQRSRADEVQPSPSVMPIENEDAEEAASCRRLAPSTLRLLPLKPILIDRGHMGARSELDPFSSPDSPAQSPAHVNHKKRVTLL